MGAVIAVTAVVAPRRTAAVAVTALTAELQPVCDVSLVGFGPSLALRSLQSCDPRWSLFIPAMGSFRLRDLRQ